MIQALLAIAFMLELITFMAFSALVSIFTTNGLLRILSFVILFVFLIAFWSLFMAPRAPKKFSPAPYYCSKLIIYTVSALVLFKLYGTGAGTIFIIVWLADELLLRKHNLAKP